MQHLSSSTTITTTHYTLHTTHYTLHTTHYTLHTIHYTLHTTHYTLHTNRYNWVHHLLQHLSSSTAITTSIHTLICTASYYTVPLLGEITIILAEETKYINFLMASAKASRDVQFPFQEGYVIKLDGVGPVDNRSSNDYFFNDLTSDT